jgi:hypothetical protein
MNTVYIGIQNFAAFGTLCTTRRDYEDTKGAI